ncbi:MAG: CAP domain-containing protein [Armatimonadota bacterium]|nr:CAP domain-containing protein [Armatimonadota bacterium]
MTQLSLYFGMLMLTANFSSTAQDIPGAPPAIVSPAPAQPGYEEQRFVDLVNYERWSRGMEQLQVDPVLVRAARAHSREMAYKDYFDHRSPTPGLETAMDRYLNALGPRPDYAYLGENLFYCSIVDVNRGHDRLMNSSGHRDNILNDRFDHIGVGVYKSSDGQFWVTEMFLSNAPAG